jgi:uncharacterized protein (TIGR03083 family)
MDPGVATDTIAAAGAAATGACRSGPAAAVTCCPGWTVSRLVTHLGLVHAWAASTVVSGASERQPFPSAPAGLSGDALADWADSQREALLEALAGADPERSVWTFAGMAPAWFWWRRQCHETTIHAWDATAAVGAPWVMPGDVADDGLDEFFDFLRAKWAAADLSWGSGKTVHFHRTDGDGERLLTIESPPVISHDHAKGDLAVRGSAADLLLWAMNRPARVDLFGDTALAAAWREHVKI